MKIYNTTVRLSESGTVAWTSCRMDWDIMAGDELAVHLSILPIAASGA